MKKILYTLILLTVVASANFTATAQEEDSTKQGVQFKVSMNYNSNLNYYGRVDSLRSSGVFPMAELWFTPKWYVNAAPIFVNNPLQKMDYAGTVATLGYLNVTDKWLTSLSAIKPFYTKETQLVQSALKAQGSVLVSKLNRVLNVSLGGDVKFSDKVDFGATAGLDHIFRIAAKDGSVVVIDPSVYAYAGTQQFYRSYTRRKSSGILLPPRDERVTEEGTTFNILAYEASLPLIYVKGKWQLMATPSYIIPQNLLQVPDRPDLTERGENTFYTTLAVKYTF
ncbi:MAG TPA: hypothetical protein VGE66_09335 [Chitinophagaceae bacterium]